MKNNMNEKKEVLIKIDNVGKIYNSEGTKFKALESISLEIHKGELIGLSGKSGSGKTTLLNVAGLIDPPSSGNLYIKGTNTKDLKDFELSKIRANEIGYIFQSFNLLPLLSAQENVEYPLMLLKMNDEKRAQMAKAALETVGLKDFFDRRPGQLSGGQRQRVAIARAIVKNPSLILADEPTANLDTKTSEEIFELLLNLQDKLGVTIMLCSHDKELIAKTKRQIQIVDGKLVSDSGSGV